MGRQVVPEELKGSQVDGSVQEEEGVVLGQGEKRWHCPHDLLLDSPCIQQEHVVEDLQMLRNTLGTRNHGRNAKQFHDKQRWIQRVDEHK